MKSNEFAYWLQGFFELSNTNTLDEKQVQMIKNHLKLVFLYDIDPSYSDDKTVQTIFQNIHDGKPSLDGINITKVVPRLPQRDSDVIVKC
jgi:hypothetical protein